MDADESGIGAPAPRRDWEVPILRGEVGAIGRRLSGEAELCIMYVTIAINRGNQRVWEYPSFLIAAAEFAGQAFPVEPSRIGPAPLPH